LNWIGLISLTNLVTYLENKISTANKTKKKLTTIQCKTWMFINVIKIYHYNILKTPQWSYLLTK
jgi:hypothetical protein